MAAPIIAGIGKAVLTKVATKVVKDKAKGMISKRLGTGAEAADADVKAGREASQLPGADKVHASIESGAMDKNHKLQKRFDSYMRDQLNIPSEQMLKDSNFGPKLSESFSKVKDMLKSGSPISHIIDKESKAGKIAQLGAVNREVKDSISMEMEAQAFNEPVPQKVEQVSILQPSNAGKI